MDISRYRLLRGRADLRRARKRQAEAEAEVVRQPTDLRPEQVQRLLTQGEITAIELLPWGSNYSFAVVLSLDGEPDLIGIYKPRRGESPLWDFPDGTLYKREYASYLLSQELGWGFIPPTTVRDGPHGIGTVQLYVEPDGEADYYELRGKHALELQQMSLFDVVTNNADRKASHCFRGREGRIWGIDHGLTFHTHPKLRTVIWDFCGQEIPEPLRDALQELATNSKRLRDLRATLREWLDRHEVDVTLQRLERVAALERFPGLDPRRNVPRGWW